MHSEATHTLLRASHGTHIRLFLHFFIRKCIHSVFSRSRLRPLCVCWAQTNTALHALQARSSQITIKITDLEVIFRLIDPPPNLCRVCPLGLGSKAGPGPGPGASALPQSVTVPSPISIPNPVPMPNPHLFFRPRTAAHMQARRLDPGELWPGPREVPGPQAIHPPTHCPPGRLARPPAVHLVLEFHP